MEKTSIRDQALLGYGCRNFIGNPVSSPKIPCRNSNVDFSDVYGGPPRCLTSDNCHSIDQNVDSLLIDGGEEKSPLHHSRFNFSERPVFGGESPNRRRQLGADFFGDIFNLEDSLKALPRKHGRDPFSASSPASRTLSPARPLLPRLEEFSGASPLPQSIGPSSKLAKANQSPTLGRPCGGPPGKGASASSSEFPNQKPCLVRVASETQLGQDTSSCDGCAIQRQGSLSHEFSIIGDGSSEEAISARQQTGSRIGKDHTPSEALNNNDQFHFSIYKWAGKRVTSMMPSTGGRSSNSKFLGKNESIVSGSTAPVLQGDNSSFDDRNVLPMSSSFNFQHDIKDDSSSQDLNLLVKDGFLEKSMPSKYEEKSLLDLLNTITNEPGKSHSSGSGDLYQTGFRKNIIKEEGRPRIDHDCCLNKIADEPGKGMVKPLRQENCAPKRSDLISSENFDSDRVKKQIDEKIILNHAHTNGPNSLEIKPSSEGKMAGNNVKGKVKEFIKIFNEEASSKLTSISRDEARSCRKKKVQSLKREDATSSSAPKTDKIDGIGNGHSFRKLQGDAVNADQYSRQTREADINVSNILDSSLRKDGTSETCSETSRYFREAFGTVQESLGEDLLVNCQVKQSPKKLEKQQETKKIQEEIQVLEAKIKQWSHGKERNIRSLLSTLQFILWPESGWKPVPLVDIVEGNSVKRAYQKALLCLHPDKLQQKSALMHQRYIAEKVFGILQDAWDHFSSLSSI